MADVDADPHMDARDDPRTDTQADPRTDPRADSPADSPAGARDAVPGTSQNEADIITAQDITTQGRPDRAARPSSTFQGGLLHEIPSMRAFALSLTGKADRADDLVQETVMKAWVAHQSFVEGSNMRAWLFTILRNAYFTDLRRKRREIEDVNGQHASAIGIPGEQMSRLDMSDFQLALARLPPDQREVLTLVGASGFSYEEAADICGVAVGTIKSRLNRARARLAGLLSIRHVSEIGPDHTTLAATTPTPATSS